MSLLGEYLYDNRGSKTPNGLNDDVLLGFRIVMNDSQSRQFLLGAIADRKNRGQLFSMEGSRRIGESWKAELEVRLLNNISENEFLYFVRNDAYVQFSIARYF